MPYFQENMNSINYPEHTSIDEDDDNMNIYNSIDKSDNISVESVESDIEWQLENLNRFNNEKQLELLKKEIGHIMVHSVIPPEGWFDERYKIIMEYYKLGWGELAKRFKNKDEYIHNTAHIIQNYLEELMEERYTRPNFTIRIYYQMIMNVHSIWHYYSKVYVGNEEDTDVIDLIEGMKFL
jgi:hypothetical protein